VKLAFQHDLEVPQDCSMEHHLLTDYKSHTHTCIQVHKMLTAKALTPTEFRKASTRNQFGEHIKYKATPVLWSQ